MSHCKRSELGSHNLLHQGYQVLETDFSRGRGTSKHEDKLDGAGYDGKIYTDTTLRSYKAAWKDFDADLKAQGIKCKSLSEAAQFVPGYIERLKDRPGKDGLMSAWTIRLRFAGVAKVLGLSAKDFDLPIRHRADITRSRDTVDRVGDKHFSIRNNQGLIDFCRCTGLRKDKELTSIKGTDLVEKKDGGYAIHVRQGKGGKERICDIVGTPEQVKAIVEKMRAAGDSFVIPKVHANADVHSYRADYAKMLYESVARPIDQVPRTERYYCRGDRKGVVYDRVAMEYVSKQLGHNRVNVIASHYL